MDSGVPPFWGTSICRDSECHPRPCPMGCFFQVLGLFPWRTATIRNLAETALFVAVDVVKITAPDSLHPGKVWENPMKHIKIIQNQIKIQIRWLHFPSLFNVGHCPSLGRLPGATSNSDAAPWPEISWN